jgi:hypothetical protein
MDDDTYGGYLARHARPPAFAGSDGQAYSAALLVDDEPDTGGRFGGALLFVRWGTGDLPTGHVETEYLVFGDTRDEAEHRLAAMTLLEVKQHLDRSIAEQRGRPDW